MMRNANSNQLTHTSRKLIPETRRARAKINSSIQVEFPSSKEKPKASTEALIINVSFRCKRYQVPANYYYHKGFIDTNYA